MYGARGPTLADMPETPGDTYLIEAVEEGVVHRSVQELWRAQNAEWRARVLGQLRQVTPADEIRAQTA
jgi:hypothetical protein